MTQIGVSREKVRLRFSDKGQGTKRPDLNSDRAENGEFEGDVRRLSAGGLGGGDQAHLLHLRQLVDHVPILSQPAIAHHVDIDACDAEVLTLGCHADEAAADGMPALVQRTTILSPLGNDVASMVNCSGLKARQSPATRVASCPGDGSAVRIAFLLTPQAIVRQSLRRCETVCQC